MSSIPEKIGRYRIQKELGRGSMGVVYRAEDPALGRRVALKTIHQELSGGEAYQKRFFAEARAAAALSHPGIVVVYDIGLDPGSRQLFMALEYLEGTPLDALLAKRRSLRWRDALRVCQRMAEALHHAHTKGIIHRDVKPSNVMLLAAGEPKIMDFGIAKLPASQLTRAGEVFGSPAYMSPERALEHPVDARTDVFSLGAVLYELLTGERAFPGPSIPVILRNVAQLEPEPPSRRAKGLPPGLDAVVARALAKSPGQRYASAQMLAEDLGDLLEGAPPRHAGSPGTAKTPVVGSGTQVSGEGKGTHPTARGLALPKGKRVSLAILSGPSQGDVVAVEQPRTLIGRAGSGSGAAVAIADAEVSGTHAALECYGEKIVLRDLGSTNGTFVGDERILHHDLSDQTEFRVGKTRIMLMLSEES